MCATLDDWEKVTVHTTCTHQHRAVVACYLRVQKLVENVVKTLGVLSSEDLTIIGHLDSDSQDLYDDFYNDFYDDFCDFLKITIQKQY